MLFEYARVSTKDQNLHMQFDALKKYGVGSWPPHIAHISGPLYTGTGLNRFKGYRMALNAAGIEFKTDDMYESIGALSW
ncbi:hypothetical protein MUO14_13025 [Halobacillus shinanisalinarum]|uniref:Resolvase/invertase-type recombinase catalytic domain-containing protein n=1 Tax=Halobacillus shinanisalinarum TaxID=2932258 RepID=A0ABY4GU89_9BACI|nr:hypothetical protein [Halobacillus shinanisalinarum]UOQ91506.1 hypothetical protein MUO14_13025 [Halobacillus shinanisalinarum]